MQLSKQISDKIAQIRLEPEHVRLRWVWGAVAVSMFFVLAIWIFSIGSLFKGEKNSTDSKSSDASDITEKLRDLKQQAPSIKDFSDTSLPTMTNEGITPVSNGRK
jgi:hypothetical protein